MKQLLPILFSICLLAICNAAFGQNGKTDTLYLQKDSLFGNLQSIYQLPIGKSDQYDDLRHFELHLDNNQYMSSIYYYTENDVKFEHHKPLVPWTEWVVLQQYKNQYYVYHPCDFINHYQISMNDSLYVNWRSEGPYLNKVLSYKKIDNLNYEVTFTGDYANAKIKIHIIDNKRGIAVFEQEYSNSTGEYIETFYSLMIAADKIKTVPIIINNCQDHKSSELVFDEIDFPALLKK